MTSGEDPGTCRPGAISQPHPRPDRSTWPGRGTPPTPTSATGSIRSTRPALARLPDGPSVFRGLPFALGTRAAGRRWILVDRELAIDLAPRAAARAISSSPISRTAGATRHGDRPPGMPVGWVFPTGEPLARYGIELADGRTIELDVRRRFEVADGIIGWGFLPFAAIGHRIDETLDWRGPYPRQVAGSLRAGGPRRRADRPARLVGRQPDRGRRRGAVARRRRDVLAARDRAPAGRRAGPAARHAARRRPARDRRSSSPG